MMMNERGKSAGQSQKCQNCQSCQNSETGGFETGGFETGGFETGGLPNGNKRDHERNVVGSVAGNVAGDASAESVGDRFLNKNGWKTVSAGWEKRSMESWRTAAYCVENRLDQV